MKSIENSSGPVLAKKSALKAMLLTFPMFLIIWMMILQGHVPKKDLEGAASVISVLFLTSIFFMMLYSGKTYKYRKLVFVAAAFCFPIPFITHLIELRGSMSFDADALLNNTIPFCHLVIPVILVPAALTKTIIFPGSMFEGFANISSMLIIWIGASLALGRGWCSWVCFYGGLDEGFTYLSKKPKLKIDRKWTYLPWAVLTAVVLLSAATLSPFYCEWMCPFKTVTEFAAITSVKILFQTIIFVSLFIGLVIVLPILTGKRSQCTVLCPFAAFQSLTNKINIFDIRTDPESCINCKKCIRKCPTLSIEEKSLEKGKTLMSCTKCGGCVDVCGQNAVAYHIKGTDVAVKPEIARGIYLYTAYIFTAAIGGGMIAGAILNFLKLASTGSMI